MDAHHLARAFAIVYRLEKITSTRNISKKERPFHGAPFSINSIFFSRVRALMARERLAGNKAPGFGAQLNVLLPSQQVRMCLSGGRSTRNHVYNEYVATTVLQTKLYVPPLRSNFVPRPRLIAKLHAGLSGRLTMISAPAGYGKTTLIAEWLQDVRRPFSWLSLDKTDNDPVRFLIYFTAALQQIQAGVGETALAMFQSPQAPPAEASLGVLVNEIASVKKPFILVLDDYHSIETREIHELLGFILGHLPPQMHLALLTRQDPLLPITRLRASGLLTEIRQEDLRFTADESAVFLVQAMGLHLSTDDISVLVRRTEGWIAGLQLAALSIQGRSDKAAFLNSFAGSSRFILDYLLEEVFDAQTSEVRKFLLETSILERLSAPVCDSVTANTGSQALLENLDHANLFIVPLDQSRTWYRYHHLFADLLRHQLSLQRPENTIAHLHQRASRWYGEHAFLAEAIQHSLAARDWEGVIPLLIRSSREMLERSEIITFLKWHKSLPEDVILSHPALCINLAWALTLTGQYDAAGPYLQRAEEIAGESPELSGQILVAKAYIAREKGEIPQAIQYSEQALVSLPRENLQQRGLVAMNLGILRWGLGDLLAAESAFKEARSAGKATGTENIHKTALSFLGRIMAVHGNLRQAEKYYRKVIGDQSPPSPASGLAHMDLAALHLEWNNLEDASPLVSTGIMLSQRSGNLPVQVIGHQCKTQILLALGDLAGARGELETAKYLAEKPGIPPGMRFRNAAIEAELALAQADLIQAGNQIEILTGAPISQTSTLYPHIVAARILISRRDREAASKLLNQIADAAQNSDLRSELVAIRILQSLTSSSVEAAQSHLIEALRLGQDEGYIRTFTNLGEPVAKLLSRLKKQKIPGIRNRYINKLLSAFPKPDERKAPTETVKAQASLVELLSEREYEVLKLLADHRTNQEIGEELFISVNTVKAHLKNIYGKLEVPDRRKAVIKARELDIL